MFSSTYSLSRADWLVNVEDNHNIWSGLNWDSPTLVVSDVPKAIQFYEKVFNFLPIFILPDENDAITFARMRYRGTYFALASDNDISSDMTSLTNSDAYSSTSFYLYVDNVDKVFARALAQGCRLLQAPRIDSLGNHHARLMDIFGYVWDIAARI